MTGQASFAPSRSPRTTSSACHSTSRATLATPSRKLARDGWLRGLQRGAFIDRLAHHLANVNALHPFRDGNGRAQRAFFSQLAAEAGFDLHWQLISPEANNAAAVAAMQGDERPLRGLLGEITSERSDPPTGSS
jgi:fido (protein-threonine AMPylation protein)